MFKTRSLCAALGLLALALTACPSNFCLVKVCKGSTANCRCSWSTCPGGSSFDTAQNTCVCEAGRVPLNGGCLTLTEANDYCGRGAHFEARGCVRNVCASGQELDHETGQCLLKQQVDQIAQNMGVPVGQGQKLGCPPGLVLVMENPQSASCVPIESTCARDETWDGKSCVKSASCPPGSIFDAAQKACIAYTSGDSADDYSVDLAQWVTASYGPTNGSGTSAFCGSFSKKPSSFGVLPGGSIRVVVDIGVHAPSQQVAQASVVTQALVEASGTAVTAKGATEVQRAAQELLSTLVRQGGKSNSPQATTRVRCLIVNAAKPGAVPATGGF